jgi:hypothetical protein
MNVVCITHSPYSSFENGTVHPHRAAAILAISTSDRPVSVTVVMKEQGKYLEGSAITRKVNGSDPKGLLERLTEEVMERASRMVCSASARTMPAKSEGFAYVIGSPSAHSPRSGRGNGRT